MEGFLLRNDPAQTGIFKKQARRQGDQPVEGRTCLRA